MKLSWTLFSFIACQVASVHTADSTDDEVYRLPSGFLLGAGTSAYQCEGAWNEDGKGMSVIDYALHVLNVQFAAGESGDVAADSYHHVMEDIQLIKSLKLNIYRFSISWPRLLPNGDLSKINYAGVRYYNHLLEELQKINVTPIVTLLQFDHPYNEHFLHDWWRPELPAYFEAYARFAFETFGDKVRYWTTINEPGIDCERLVPVLYKALGQSDAPGDHFYECIRNHLLAHARAFRLYKAEFAAQQQGEIGVSVYTIHGRPNTTRFEDLQAAVRYNTFRYGIFLYPVVYGDFPGFLIDQVAMQSQRDGRNASRLQPFSDKEKTSLKGSFDFLGLNVYGGNIVADPGPSGITVELDDHPLERDGNVVLVNETTGEVDFTLSTGVQTTNPWPLRETLLYVRDNFNNPNIFITENGPKQAEHSLQDPQRVRYFSTYLRELAKTINVDKVRVVGYTAWSLFDVFEWTDGYRMKMGLAYVNFDDINRNRTLRDSAKFFRRIVEENLLVPLVTSESTSSTFPVTCVVTLVILSFLINLLST